MTAWRLAFAIPGLAALAYAATRLWDVRPTPGARC